jgi:hypothetical protein
VGNVANSDFREIVPAGSDARKIGVYEFTNSDITEEYRRPQIGVSEFCNSDLPTTSRQCCQKVDADKTSAQFFVAVGDSFP